VAYWKCTKAEIKGDGRLLELSFHDAHGGGATTIQMPSEVWKDIMTFRNAYDEPYRRQAELHRQLSDYMFNSLMARKEKEESK
jgi:hypothetical protein